MPASKEYMKEYYNNNKEKMINQIKKINAEKIECPNCSKIIQKQWINKHKLTKTCMNSNINNNKYDKLKEEIEQLKELIKNKQ
jgi:hypothetical protein